MKYQFPFEIISSREIKIEDRIYRACSFADYCQGNRAIYDFLKSAFLQLNKNSVVSQQVCCQGYIAGPYKSLPIYQAIDGSKYIGQYKINQGALYEQ